MPKLQNLLKRRRDDPVDPDIQERLVKRLASLSEPFASDSEGATFDADARSASARELPGEQANGSMLDELDAIALADTYRSLFVGEPPAIEAVDQVEADEMGTLDDQRASEPAFIDESAPIAAMQVVEPAADAEPVAIVDTPESRPPAELTSAELTAAEPDERPAGDRTAVEPTTSEPVEEPEWVAPQAFEEAPSAPETAPAEWVEPVAADAEPALAPEGEVKPWVAVPVWTTPDEHLPVAPVPPPLVEAAVPSPAVAAPTVPAAPLAARTRARIRIKLPSRKAPAATVPVIPDRPEPLATVQEQPSRQEPAAAAPAKRPAAALAKEPAAAPAKRLAAAPAKEAAAAPAKRLAAALAKRPAAALAKRPAAALAKEPAAPLANEPAAAPAKRPAAAPAKRLAGQPKRAIATVACPYCAEPLDSPPVASVRCRRCRQRIVVRRVGERFVYLTEAALPIFLAQRRLSIHAGRWTRERDRWLGLATASGAAAERVAKIAAGVLSEETVKSARLLYFSTVERNARDARRDRRWEEASRVRFEQAQTVYRIARSPRPVPAEVLQLHRDGLASTLRGIGEIAKSAELRAGTCCDVCRADDGRFVRIADELRTPTLPHADCPKGLCRCRWSLADRDRTIVSGLLRRHLRPPRR